MNWKELFTKGDLEKGRSLYKVGKAKRLGQTDTGFTATVRDLLNHHVVIDLNEVDEIDWMDCDCRKSNAGYLCEHMAAALFLIEREYGSFDADEEAFEMETSIASQAPDQIKEASDSGQMEPALIREVQKAVAGGLDQLQAEEKKEVAVNTAGDGAKAAVANYRYFQADRFMEGLGISERTKRQAQELIKKGEVSDLQVQIGFSGYSVKDELTGMAYSSIRHSYGRCRLIFGRERIISEYCSDWACGYKPPSRNSYLGKDLCVHEVATLMLLVDYLKKFNPGDATNRAGFALMGYMPQIAAEDENVETTGLLKISPTGEVDEFGRLSVSFRIGAGKLYKITNLRDFHGHMLRKENMQFGKKTVLRLGEDRLDEMSQKWMQFIDGNIREDDRRSLDLIRKYGRSFAANVDPKLVKGEIALYGSAMDDFFDLIQDQQVEFIIKHNGEKEKRMITAASKDVRLQLSIRQEKDTSGNFIGIRMEGQMPTLVRGHQYAYFLEGDHLNRIGYELSQKLDPLMQSSRNGEIDIRIGRKNLGDFYRKALPGLREIAEVAEPDEREVELYLPPIPRFVIYLDTLDGSVIARADVYYGNKAHSLLELLCRSRNELEADPYRALEEEREVMETLLKYLPNFDEESWILFLPKDEILLFDFLDHGLDELLSMAEVRMTDRFRRLGLKKRVSFTLGVSVESNLLDLQVTSDELSNEELLAVLSGYQRKCRYVRLHGGDFLKLEGNETIAQLSALMETLQMTPEEFVKGKMHIPAYRALYLDKMLEQTQDLYADRDALFRKLIKDFKTVQDSDFAIPKAQKNILRKYQADGVRWLRTLDHYGFGGILADEMGLGKTIQIITLLQSIKEEEEEHGTALVICPASLIYNWAEEFARFAPDLNVKLVAGTKTARLQTIAEHALNDVLITSYDLLKRDINAYAGTKFRFQIIDEAQYIKNQQTAAAKAVKLIDSKTRFALTGTPIENRLSELWSIFDYLMPGFLYTYSKFRADLEQPIVKNGNEAESLRLRAMVTPFILRRQKKDVLKDLPEKLEEVRYAGMEDKQRKVYNAQVVRMSNDLRNADDQQLRQSKIEILAELTKIRQICCDPSLLFENYDGSSAKREACMDLVRSAIDGGHRMLIFSQFTSMLELLSADLKKEGIEYYTITGATPKEQRLKLVKIFNEGDVPVFLISLKAGGTGLNLTGADIVIHYDPWWNIAAQNQATDRAHRIGQEKMVTVYKLIVKNTIEEKILQMQEAKKKLADDILSGESISSATLTKEELLGLLEKA